MFSIRFHTLLNIFSVLVALGALVGVWVLVWELSAEQEARASAAFAYESANKKDAYLSTVRALLRETERERSALSALATGRDPVSVIRILEDAARAAHVTLTVDAVTPAHDADDAASYLVAAHVAGKFSALHGFVALLDHAPFPSRLEQVTIEKTEGAWHASVVLRVYAENAS